MRCKAQPTSVLVYIYKIMGKLLGLFFLFGVFVLSSCKKSASVDPAEVKDIVPKSAYAMLIVESESCIYCKQLNKDLRSDPNLQRAVEGVDVFRLLAESNARVRYKLEGREGETTEEELARALNVRAYPHIIFYDAEGNVILRIPGYVPPKTLACTVNYIKNEIYMKEDLNQYLKKENCV